MCKELDKLGLSYLVAWLEILRTERSGRGDSLHCGLHYQILDNIEKRIKELSNDRAKFADAPHEMRGMIDDTTYNTRHQCDPDTVL